MALQRERTLFLVTQDEDTISATDSARAASKAGIPELIRCIRGRVLSTDNNSAEWGSQAGAEVVNMDLRLDGTPVQNVDVPNQQNDPGLFTITATLPVGTVEFSVAFLNDFFDSATLEDRNLLVDWLQVEGPFNVTLADGPYRAKLYTCDPAVIDVYTCAR